jgi:hypothetical protein
MRHALAANTRWTTIPIHEFKTGIGIEETGYPIIRETGKCEL